LIGQLRGVDWVSSQIGAYGLDSHTMGIIPYPPLSLHPEEHWSEGWGYTEARLTSSPPVQSFSTPALVLHYKTIQRLLLVSFL